MASTILPFYQLPLSACFYLDVGKVPPEHLILSFVR